MPPRRRKEPEEPTSRLRPVTTPEARENQLVGLANDLAAKQLADGTASAQVISHFLRLGSSREKLEQERLKRENELLEAKAEAMASQKRVEELYTRALNAMRSYSGFGPAAVEDDYED